MFRRMGRHLIAMATGTAVLVGSAGLSRAAVIPVPNGSFENQTNNFVNINIDAWQKSPKPDWYDESGGTFWSQLTGAFKNTPATSADHIDNCDGDQAIWMFAVPEVAIFQDYDSMDWNDPTPTHAFDARFDAGQSYQLTVGVIGGGGGMPEGARLEIGWYYRDAATNRVTVSATSITNTADLFPTQTHFVDFQVRVRTVKPGDAWAGQQVGVQFLSTVTTNLQGGYWDLDHVRLEAILDPPTLTLTPTGPDLRISWSSAAGYQYQLKTSEDLEFWSEYDSPLPGTGGEVFKLIPASSQTNGYFRVLATPVP